MRPKRTGSFIPEPRVSTVERPAERTCSAPSSSTGCSGYSAARFADSSESATRLANIALRLGREKLRWNPETERVLDDDKANAMLTRESRKPWAI